MEETKVCSSCNVEKEVTAFGKNKQTRDGYRCHCKECVARQSREYYPKRKEAHAAITKRYYEEHKEEATERSRKRRVINPEASREACRKWQKSHKEVDAARAANRRAFKLLATVGWGNKEAIKVFYNEAARLTKETGIPHHVDHIVPLQGKNVSGLHWEGNLQILTASENCSKGNRF